MDRIKRILMTLITLIASINIFAANNAKAIADTFCITNHDIQRLLSEDYVNKNGNLKQKYYAELKNGVTRKDIPKKAHISKSDYTYVGDANKSNITVGLYLIVKKGQSRIVRGVNGKKTCKFLPTQNMHTSNSFAALPQNNDVTCVQQILKVKDGDTFDYLDCNGEIHTVRMAGIDTPEKGQPFANKAKEKLSTLLKSGKITMLRTGSGNHHRLAMEVFVDGIDVNLELVKCGLAWREPRFDKSGKYIQAEAEAKRAKIGLWSDPTSVAPWEYRASKKK